MASLEEPYWHRLQTRTRGILGNIEGADLNLGSGGITGEIDILGFLYLFFTPA